MLRILGINLCHTVSNSNGVNSNLGQPRTYEHPTEVSNSNGVNSNCTLDDRQNADKNVSNSNGVNSNG